MPILTGKTIGQLTQLTSAKEDMLFAVEYTGSTYHIPYSSITQSFGNKWYIPTGEIITVKSDYQYFIYGNIINDGTLILESNSELVVVNGSFTNNGTFTNGGTLSVIEIPLFDTKVTGGTYSAGTITFTNNSGGTFTVTGLEFTGNTSANCITDLYVDNLYGCSPITIHDSLQSTGSTASGILSIAYGQDNKSIGDYTHSEGSGTTAYGEYSHSEGYGTIAFGEASHSEGYNTSTSLKGFQVSGSTSGGVFRLSPSYGNVTSAFTINKLLLISTDGSYVNVRPQLIKNLTFSGGQTIITTYRVVTYVDPIIVCENNLNDQNASALFGGLRAHSEGVSTKSLGLGTHSEGRETISTNDFSHSEGYFTNAHSSSSHAEGYETTAGGSGRWVNISYGEVAHHSEGYQTQSIGDYSHSEGAATFSIGPGSHSEGNGTYSVGDGSHSEGLYTNSGVLAFPVFSANNSTILIDTNVDLSSEIYSFGGLFVKTVPSFPTFISKWMKVTITGTTFYSGTSKFEIRTSSTSLPTISYVFHEDVKAPYNGERTFSDYSHSEGFRTATIGSYSHSEGSNTIAGEEFSHAEGLFTLSNGAGSHSEGISTDAVGDYSHAEGDGTTSIGIGSHSEGYQTTSLGLYSHSEGIGTIALNNYQHVSGKYNLTATTEGAFILGNGTDNSNRSNLLVAGGGEVNVSGKTITTNFQMTSGASTSGYVLVNSDGSGNAQWQPISGITGVVNKYSITLTNPSGGTHTITHNLGTSDISVSLYLITADEIAVAQINNRQTNSVEVFFSTSPGEDVRVVIIG